MHNKKSLPLIELVNNHLRQGDRAKARKAAQHLVNKHPEILEGWLFLAGLSDDPTQRMEYLAKAHQIAPGDPRVIKALDWSEDLSGDSPSDTAPITIKGQATAPTTGEENFSSQPVSPQKEITTIRRSWLTRLNENGLFRGFVHMGKKALLIAITIIIGTFITIQIMNRDVVTGFTTDRAQLDALMERHVEHAFNQYSRENQNLSWEELEEFRTELIRKSGIELPKFQRHLRWTLNALTFDWGGIRVGESIPWGGFFRPQQAMNLNEIILNYLPNTLLLVGSAYLLVFLLGLPLSLRMSRNYGKWYDKLFSFFAALSSIPSWVYGILLITIFALELRLLPTGRMVGNFPPETTWGYVLVVGRHMILPVSAIFLSVFFTLVYSWRTFFITFSSEDYVELGKAVGMSDRKLERNYILKPTLPYVITSFSLMFVTFWQMTLALEVVFNWPGIGWLYVVRALPNLWGESTYPGDLVISISLVVMFAYLMGMVVLLLDLAYVIVDPRIRLSKEGNNLRLMRRKANPFTVLKRLFQTKESKSTGKSHSPKTTDRKRLKNRWNANPPKTRPGRATHTSVKFRFEKGLKRAVSEIVRYPSAIIGFIIISILILGSLYAVVFLPYENIGDEWSRSHLGGQPTRPQLAKPAWTNLFLRGNYLSTMTLDSKAGDAVVELTPLNEDTNHIVLTFSFDYDYAAFPSEMLLYLSSTFDSKRGFAEIFWRTPDGRELELRTTEVASLTNYDFEIGINYRRWVSDNPNWAGWFNTADLSQNPTHYLLFADPAQTEPAVVQGQYQLVIDGFTFEADSDIQAELVMLGQVYGAAGTDFYRRDLVVPLLWGMPFALLIGLGGALFTTIISMALAASGVWFGGWVDNFVQRLIDVNLVLPILAIAVMAYAFLGISVWTILIIYVFLNAFGTPTKNFRSAFLQIKDAPYIEAAKAYGAKNYRIILKYMVPRLIPVLVPQLVILIPAFVFLEATLGFFNIRMLYPTWGTVIYQATMRGGLFGSRFWMLQPIALLLLTGLGFSLFGFALERILNPRLSDD
jgi:peptide/nickel transport system permease protein